ncbi:MAG TPA: aspartate 1-decarboxylase [Opitutaceae bacterium]|nr:aspartate 1-decarboxylase [Opitutaceae bacterium]
MLRTFLRAKLHRAVVTSADPDYEGSISIDRALCREAGLLEFEQVDIYDINNGARFTTYVIYGEPGQIQINGAAARLVDVGDRVIICAYLGLEPKEVPLHSARIVQVGPSNQVVSVHTNSVREP